MRRLTLALLIAGTSLASGAACAQSDGQGARPAPTRPMPSYREEPMPATDPAGGYDETITSGDARRDERPPPSAREDEAHRRDSARTAELNRRHLAPAPASEERADYQAERARYAERIARWRARANACEAGNTDACEGPGE